MADLIVNQGISDYLRNWFGIGSQDAIDAMGVSDFGSLAAGTTSIGAASFSQVNALAGTPTETSQVASCNADFTQAQINGNEITTITLHNDGAGADTGVQGGQDAQSLTFQNVDINIQVDVGGASA